MEIFVTGGAGFIGSSLIKYLLDHTNHRIINIDSLTYAGNLESLEPIDSNPNYIFEQVNICNFKALEHLFQKYSPSLVMHLAAESHVDNSIENPLDFINTNIIGTYNLLQCSRMFFEKRLHGNKELFKFLHVSTDEVFGDIPNLSDFFSESSPYDPSSPYSASKAGSDHLVRAWHRTFNLPIVISNCSNNYGPFQFPEKLIPKTIINLCLGKQIPIYGNGEQIRDWLFVQDHVKALYKIAINGESGESYNVGGNNEKKNIDVVTTICSIADDLISTKPGGISSFKDLIYFTDDRPGHDQRYAIDCSKLYSKLGWVAEESFSSGIQKTVEWYANNKQWWGRVLSGEYRNPQSS